MRITDQIEMLQIPFGNGTINPVLAWDQENLVLIDAGFPNQAEAFRNAIAQAGQDIGRLTTLLITHQDGDHVGGVRSIKPMAPKLTVCSHALEASYIDGSKLPIKLARNEQEFDSLPPERQQAFLQAKQDYLTRQVTVDRLLNDREVLSVCGGIEVVHTPGHTPGHVCYFFLDSGVLVAGDALNVSDGVLAGPNPVHTYDMDLALHSVRKLMDYPIRIVLAYHGGLFDGDVHAALAAIVA